MGRSDWRTNIDDNRARALLLAGQNTRDQLQQRITRPAAKTSEPQLAQPFRGIVGLRTPHQRPAFDCLGQLEPKDTMQRKALPKAGFNDPDCTQGAVDFTNTVT